MEDSNLKFSQVFRQQWRLILTVTLLFTCLCAVLIYQHKPIYRAKVILAPLTELDSSFQNVSVMNYLEISKDKNFNLTEIYNLLERYLASQHLKQIFYTEVYLPSIKQGQESKEGYEHFSKAYDMQLYMENKQRKYLVSTTDNNPEKAIAKLTEYIAFINSKVVEQIRLSYGSKKRRIEMELSLPRVLRRVDPYLSGICALNFKVFNILNILSRPYDDYIPFQPPLANDSVIGLCSYDLALYNTKLEPKLAKTLCLGIFGGLILGFLIGAFRIGVRELRKAPN